MVWDDRFENWVPKANDARTPGDVDYGRVIHSASFRRLQGKTQILNLGDGDFYRTRLTHSLEVAQIAGGIVNQLHHDFPVHPALEILPERSTMQAIACCHDLGHPPFGHGGEVALNYCMRGAGGFEGNGQTLRILSRLEKMSKEAGSNLTRESLLGVLKYPISFSEAANPELFPKLHENTSGTPLLDRKSAKPPKCYLDTERDVVDWILDPVSPADRELFRSATEKTNKHKSAKHKSFACSVMDVADDISFGIHDLEDVIAMGLIDSSRFEKHVTAEASRGLLDYLNTNYKGELGNDVHAGLVAKLFGNGNDRKHQINRILNFVIPSVVIVEEPEFEAPRLKYRVTLSPEALSFVTAVKDLVREEVIFSPGVQHLEFKGQMMVIAVFEVMKSDPKSFLPPDVFELYQKSTDPLRDVCDYVAGMTDQYLLKTYDRLFSPRMGSVFDRL
jgi:dGTPase